MLLKRRVVISGIGLLCALGDDLESCWQRALAGDTVVAPIPEKWRRYAEFSSNLWSPLPPIDYRQYGIDRVEEHQLDSFSLLALAAALAAVGHAGLSYEAAGRLAQRRCLKNIDRQRAGVFMGTGIGGIGGIVPPLSHQMLAQPLRELAQGLDTAELPDTATTAWCSFQAAVTPPRRFNPLLIAMVMPNACASALSMNFGLAGPARVFCSACAAGTVAIGQAYNAIVQGEIDLALTGGVEYLYDDYGTVFRGFDLIGALVKDCRDPAQANRPFDRKRSGFLFSQGGAALLVLEELESARRRGAPIVAEINGYAENNDAFSQMLVDPGGSAFRRLLQQLLAAAELSPAAIDYINSHGTATLANDEIEAQVIAEIFPTRPLVNAAKGLLGHSLGASGAIEAALTALSLRDQITYPCRNLDDPVVDLNFVTTARSVRLQNALSYSLAFGGHNAGLLLRRWEKP